MFRSPCRTRLDIGITNYDVYDYGGDDTFRVAADPVDTNVVYMQVLIPAGTGRYNHATGEWRNVALLGETGRGTNAPIVISPHDHRTIYIGGAMLWRSGDRGDNWTRMSDSVGRRVTDSITVGGVKRPKPRGTVGSISESPLERGLVYAGVSDGTLQLTRDGGATWRVVDQLPATPKTAPVRWVVASAHAAGMARSEED